MKPTSLHDRLIELARRAPPPEPAAAPPGFAARLATTRPAPRPTPLPLLRAGVAGACCSAAIALSTWAWQASRPLDLPAPPGLFDQGFDDSEPESPF